MKTISSKGISVLGYVLDYKSFNRLQLVCVSPFKGGMCAHLFGPSFREIRKGTGITFKEGVSKFSILGSDNGFSPVRLQSII